MKIFKRVYFCVLVVLLVVIVATGFSVTNNAGNTQRADNITRDNAALFANGIYNGSGTHIAHSLNTSIDDSEAVRYELWHMLTHNTPRNNTPRINLGTAQSGATRTVRALDAQGNEIPDEILFVYNEFTTFAPVTGVYNRFAGGGNANQNSWHNTNPLATSGVQNVGSHNMGRARPSIIGFGPHQGTATLPSGNHSFRYTVGTETLARFGHDDDSMHIMIGRQVNNIAVVMPGNITRRGGSAPAILLTTSMDVPRNGGGGAAAARIGAFLAEIERLNRVQDLGRAESAHEYDIIFLFTDARHDSSLGAKVFMDQFVGFRGFERELIPGRVEGDRFYNSTTGLDWRFVLDGNGQPRRIPNIVERIVLAVNFDNIGTGSTPVLLNTTNDNGQLVRAFSNISGGLSSPLINEVYSDFSSDFDAFTNIANHNRSAGFNNFENLSAMNIVSYGNVHHHNTVFDTFDRNDRHSQNQVAVVNNIVRGIIDEFGSDISGLENQREVYYFAVGRMFTVRHGLAGSIIFAVFLILLIAGTIFINIKRKAFSFVNMGKGIAVQLLVVFMTVASLFVLYFFIGLIVTGFGAMTIQHMITMVYSNAGIIIGFAVAALALMSLYYIIIKRFFEIKAIDVIRGGAILFGALAVVLAFALPSMGVMLGVPALLMLINMLLCTRFKDKFKDKFGFDIERLFLYTVPMLLFLMFFIPSIVIVASVSLTILTPILVLPFILAFMFIAPYATLLKGVMDRALGKLPPRTIVVKKQGTERVENKAKPGTFMEVSGKKKQKEKVQWKYRNGVGVAILAVVGSIIILISASFGSPFAGSTGQGIAIANSGNFTQNIYQNSLLLVRDNHGTSLRIHDTAMFRRARGWVEGFSWNTQAGAYTKNIAVPLTDPSIRSVQGGGLVIEISPTAGFGLGMSVIELSGTSHIISASVYASESDRAAGAVPHMFYNTAARDNMVIRLPMGTAFSSGAFILFEFSGDGTPSGRLEANISQYMWDLGTGQLRTLLTDTVQGAYNDAHNLLSGVLRDTDESLHGAVRFGVLLRVRGQEIVLS